MIDWGLLLRILHIVGTAIGVGAATMLEVFSIYFGRDGKVDLMEHEVLRICVTMLRIGLVILAFSGFGLLVMWRLRLLGPDTFFAPRFMAKITILLILLSVAMLVNFRLINFKLGSAISTTSWYAALILGMWRKMEASYFLIMFVYLVFIGIVYFSLEYIRKIVARRQ